MGKTATGGWATTFVESARCRKVKGCVGTKTDAHRGLAAPKTCTSKTWAKTAVTISMTVRHHVDDTRRPSHVNDVRITGCEDRCHLFQCSEMKNLVRYLHETCPSKHLSFLYINKPFQNRTLEQNRLEPLSCLGFSLFRNPSKSVPKLTSEHVLPMCHKV